MTSDDTLYRLLKEGKLNRYRRDHNLPGQPRNRRLVAELGDDASLARASFRPEVVASSRVSEGGAVLMVDSGPKPDVVIPFVPLGAGQGLLPEVRELGQQVGARFVYLDRNTSYFELFESLWAGERDFVIWEHDVLPTEELISEMRACPEPWCSGTYGRWWFEHRCVPTEGEKPCGDRPGPCGQSAVSVEIAACPLRLAGGMVLRSDSWLGLVKFGSVRKQVPDLMPRAAARAAYSRVVPLPRHFDNLCLGVHWVLAGDEGVSPHLHFPAMVHLKTADRRDDPWDRGRYEADLADHEQPS